MRIVAGTARGRALAAPEGLDTRPTTDRVREALFSSLFSLRGGFEGAIVLDAFAGSGACGLEALSRGARRAVFFERDRKALTILRKNIEACGFDGDAVRVHAADVLSYTGFSALCPFDLVFLDPPYKFATQEVIEFASSLQSAGALANDAIVVYEHAFAAREDVDRWVTQSGFSLRSTKKYGKTAVTMLIAHGEPDEEGS